MFEIILLICWKNFKYTFCGFEKLIENVYTISLLLSVCGFYILSFTLHFLNNVINSLINIVVTFFSFPLSLSLYLFCFVSFTLSLIYKSHLTLSVILFHFSLSPCLFHSVSITLSFYFDSSTLSLSLCYPTLS